MTEIMEILRKSGTSRSARAGSSRDDLRRPVPLGVQGPRHGLRGGARVRARRRSPHHRLERHRAHRAAVRQEVPRGARADDPARWSTSAPRALRLGRAEPSAKLAAEVARVLALLRHPQQRQGRAAPVHRRDRAVHPAAQGPQPRAARGARDPVLRARRRGTDVVRALEYANHVLKRRAVVFLLSDFLVPARSAAATKARPQLRAATSCAARSRSRHAATTWSASSCRDPREAELPDVGRVAARGRRERRAARARHPRRHASGSASPRRRRRAAPACCRRCAAPASTPSSSAPRCPTCRRCCASSSDARPGSDDARRDDDERRRGSEPDAGGHPRHPRPDPDPDRLAAAAADRRRGPARRARSRTCCGAGGSGERSRVPPPRPADEVALERLEAARALLDPEKAREFCFAVSEAIRFYIEDRFTVARRAPHDGGVPRRPGPHPDRRPRTRTRTRSRTSCSAATSSSSRARRSPATRWRACTPAPCASSATRARAPRAST